jgi:hypothetical protein
MLTETSSLFLFLAAFIGLLVGLLIASIFSNRESRGGKKRTAPKEIEKEGFEEAASLWYSPAGKRIITELDGEFYRDTNTLSTDQKTRVLKLLTLWKEWAEQEKFTIPASEPRIEPELEKETIPARIESPVKPFKIEQDEFDAVSELQQAYDIQEEREIAPEPVQNRELSITEQISKVLDEMLEGTPLKEKGVKLIENQQNGVDVWVGLDKYSGIDAVPDPAVKDMIRAAVLRWEQENEARPKPQN